MPNVPSQVILACALFGAVPAAAVAAAAAPAPARTFTAWDQPPPPQPKTTPELLEQGGRVFRGACLGCHGEKADGQGREGKLLAIPPRDFTAAAFLCRTTTSGALPLDTDLFRSIRHGFKPQVGMPAFTFLSDREVWAVIAHLKTLSPRWTAEQVPPPIEIGAPPPRSKDSAKLGEELYKATGCAACHGDAGHGDGPSAPNLAYDNGKPIPPANFWKPKDFKCGHRVTDIFRTIATGMDGTPMPTFAEALSAAQRWQLAYFIYSLGERGTAEAQAQR